jgi:predicted ribosomally synthesized peptide with SipW-like signal peptide
MSFAPNRRITGRKVLASGVAVIAAAGAAGLGTFGTFTDSTSTETTIRAGVVSLDLGAPGGMKTIPATTGGFLPGDSLTRALNLENNGDSPLSSISLATTTASPSVLVTDQINGLQLALKRCSVPWTKAGTVEAPTYTCGGAERLLYSGPAISTQTLSDPASLAPGRDDHLVFTISLPTTAGNDMQTHSATLGLVFTAVQRPGTAR